MELCICNQEHNTVLSSMYYNALLDLFERQCNITGSATIAITLAGIYQLTVYKTLKRQLCHWKGKACDYIVLQHHHICRGLLGIYEGNPYRRKFDKSVRHGRD